MILNLDDKLSNYPSILLRGVNLLSANNIFGCPAALQFKSR